MFVVSPLFFLNFPTLSNTNLTMLDSYEVIYKTAILSFQDLIWSKFIRIIKDLIKTMKNLGYL